MSDLLLGSSRSAGPSTSDDAAVRGFWQEALLFAVLALLGLGLVMGLSLDGPYRGVWPALGGRAARLLPALLAFFVARSLVLDALRPLILPFFVTGLFLCLLPRILGDHTNGAYRWIGVGSQSFQPVELLKVLAILATAEMLERRRPVLASFRQGVLPVICIPLAAAAVLLTQPDVGHAFFVIMLCGILVLVGGIRPAHAAVLMGIAALALLVTLGGYGHTRTRFAEYRSGEPGLQLGRSLLAFAEGGLGGTGAGNGWLKLGYLPEARNDFVLAVIGNEFGVAGSLAVVGLFALFAVAAYQIADAASTRWQLLVALGLGTMIVMQACINILGVTYTIPEKGIDLPFLSSGGTNLVFAMASVGILANIASARAAPAARRVSATAMGRAPADTRFKGGTRAVERRTQHSFGREE